MRIALTGSTGFIGSNLKNFLKDKNYEVITFGRHNFNDVKFDILKTKNIDNFKKKIDILIHSGSVSVNEFYRKKNVKKKDIVKVIESELRSLEILIKFCKFNKVKKFIFISSASVYGKNKKKKPFNTKQIAYPTDIYGGLKLAMEILGSKLFKNFISLRLFQVYGLNDLKFRLVPSVIDKKKIKLKNPYNVTDLIFYKDLNNLIHKLILSKKINRGKFNAGTGKPINLLKIVKKIIKLKPKKTFLNFGKRVPKILNYSYADKNEIYKNLKWKPSFNINLGIKELINEQKYK